MSRTIRAGRYLQPVKSEGTLAAEAGPAGVYTLANLSTYYLDVGGLSAPLLSVHFQWSSALVAVISFEDSNFDEHQASLTSTTGGDWIPEDPSTAEVEVTGTGASAAGAIITLAGGGAGGGMAHIGNLGSARVRVKVVVTTGGTLRAAHFGKD